MLCSRTLLRTTESWKRCVDEEQGCRSARSLLLGSTRLQLARPDREHAVQRSEGRKEGRKEERLREGNVRTAVPLRSPSRRALARRRRSATGSEASGAETS